MMVDLLIGLYFADYILDDMLKLIYIYATSPESNRKIFKDHQEFKHMNKPIGNSKIFRVQMKSFVHVDGILDYYLITQIFEGLFDNYKAKKKLLWIVQKDKQNSRLCIPILLFPINVKFFGFRKYNIIVKDEIVFNTKLKGVLIKITIKSLIIINQSKRQGNTMMYHFNFQTQAHLDDSDYYLHDQKSINLPTTTHNSPGSLKSEPISLQLNSSYDNSFQAGTQANHANDIWNASIHFLNNTLFGKVDENGFNGVTFFHSKMGAPQAASKTLDQAIKENSLLRSREKTKFMETLKKQTQMCGLLIELMLLFNGTLFNELTYVIHNIWQRNYLRYRQRKNKASKILPQFNCFFGFQGQQQNLQEVEMFGQIDLSEIKRAALDGVEELGHELFYSKKLKYLNLQGALASKVQKQVLKEHFLVLLKSISKTLFLSAEGLYEDEVRIPIFSEQDQEECEPFELEGSNKFVRTFSQIQQDDEFDYSLSSNKRRKLQ